MMQIHSSGPVGYCRDSRAVRLDLFRAVWDKCFMIVLLYQQWTLLLSLCVSILCTASLALLYAIYTIVGLDILFSLSVYH